MNMATTQLPRIAIASGDSAGIGTEVFQRKQQTPEVLSTFESWCREKVADHQGVGDQGGMTKCLFQKRAR